jgi:hypothetical protein
MTRNEVLAAKYALVWMPFAALKDEEGNVVFMNRESYNAELMRDRPWCDSHGEPLEYMDDESDALQRAYYAESSAVRAIVREYNATHKVQIR